MRTCKRCELAKPLEDFHRATNCRDGRRPVCKACINAAELERRRADPDKYRERDRKRYAENPARQAAQKKTARAHYQANYAAQLAYRRAHYEANRDAYLAYSAKRKALKRGVERQPYTRSEIYLRDEGRCRDCRLELKNEPNGFHIDHIVPLSLGGPDTPANVQLMCEPCNRQKWANLEGQIHLPV